MTDRYQAFTTTPIGKLLVKNLGLPAPVKLDRWTPGSPLVDGTVVTGGAGRLVDQLTASLDKLEIANTDEAVEGQTYKGLVFDATGIRTAEDLVELERFFTPKLRSLARCSRVLVLGAIPEKLTGEDRVAQRALEGFTRSLGKEIGRGSTVQLVYVAEGAEQALESTLAFYLSPKSAYVSGQVVRIGATGVTKAKPVPSVEQPLTNKVAIVTGASRGIGEQIARVLHRDGAKVLGIDVPQAASELLAVTKELDGDSLTLDITGPDAPQRIAQYVKDTYGQVDVVVHNAGITRDKRLANMAEDRFASVVAVNLIAPERITAELLAQNLIKDNGRIIGVSSMAGIAGNLGQTNYAASKAGVIGWVDELAPTLKKGITINAVAPGFIQTKMTDAMPFASREVGQRLNAMSQAGQPVDVAEAIAWYASPGSTAVNGNTVRVCGQMMLGA
ncbi:3-oxoacyl-ACP reductase [Nocardioides mangrovicus]|uniref:3-oxoacyl-ACP reductase n=1 Tax=Nocardioides mangrovicus TaxID=2478913 RepID=A0A3L8P3Z1_9ACTN|nr:3-oxoacyl-ACP reductase [Nocardioides mangrovicus]RLV49259.1 3-oxoacyl-ACP reductase [Nocardioides mangrovicus]